MIKDSCLEGVHEIYAMKGFKTFFDQISILPLTSKRVKNGNADHEKHMRYVLECARSAFKLENLITEGRLEPRDLEALSHDDFGEYQKHCPGVIFYVGGALPEKSDQLLSVDPETMKKLEELMPKDVLKDQVRLGKGEMEGEITHDFNDDIIVRMSKFWHKLVKMRCKQLRRVEEKKR